MVFSSIFVLTMSTTETTTCLNCSAELNGPYCHECGQSAKVGRLTTRRLLIDIPLSILDLEGGIFYSIWALLISPGKTVKGYLEGKRVNTVRPFALLFVLMIVEGLMRVWLFKNMYASTAELEATDFWRLVNDYPRIVSVISLVFTAMAYRILFGHDRYNYAEHLHIQCYAVNLAILYSFVVTPILHFTGGPVFVLIWNIIIAPIVSIYLYNYLFRGIMKRSWVTLLSIFSFLFSFLFFMMIGAITTLLHEAITGEPWKPIP